MVRAIQYDRERERGLDFHEDLFNPLVLVFDLRRDRSVSIAASTAARPGPRRDPGALAIPLLVRAAGQFVVQRGSQTSVIAGYHWFGDWGRDTMIALPGLTLATGRPDIAESILLAARATWIAACCPTDFRMPAKHRNTTQWMPRSGSSKLCAPCSNVPEVYYDFVRTHLYDVLSEIVAWHARGTRYGIYLDHDGLLHAGQPGVQLTWMDAKIGDWVVTPRTGKPVEIQALWYNALRVMEDLAQPFGHADDSAYSRGLADRARAGFVDLEPGGSVPLRCLDGDARDPSLPAQPDLRREPLPQNASAR